MRYAKIQRIDRLIEWCYNLIMKWRYAAGGIPGRMLEHGMECKGDWSMEYRIGTENRDSIKETGDLALTYVLCPCPRIRMSLI